MRGASGLGLLKVKCACMQFRARTAVVAERLQVDPKTVRRWRQEERLPTPVTFGGVIRWRPEAIDAWLEEQERSA